MNPKNNYTAAPLIGVVLGQCLHRMLIVVIQFVHSVNLPKKKRNFSKIRFNPFIIAWITTISQGMRKTAKHESGARIVLMFLSLDSTLHFVLNKW